MSLYGALLSGVSGLRAQSQSLGTISNNISTNPSRRVSSGADAIEYGRRFSTPCEPIITAWPAAKSKA